VPSDRKDQIAYHYDLGNEFFKLILDHKTMSYSAGLYKTGKEELATAQQNKIKLVCEWLDLPNGATVLDLGSGWGGFATYAAQKHKWRITACTLSKEQLTYCNKLIKARSLQKLISMDYRDMIIDLPKGQFDAIVMLESIEHVGKQRLSQFIGELQKKLKPGGILYIQTTGRYKPKQVDKWTLKYVFPGGYLPAKQELLDAASNNGLEVEKFVDDTPSYIFTMTEWIKQLEQNRSTIEKMFDASFYRLWELWMHGAKVAFEVNSMNLFRIKMRKPD
jgi:cyclopropane-fatty-acyl-phospholipid synthase